MSSDHLFEVSWEVCNKVGGIHTVLTSKAAEALAAFEGRYTVIGPLLLRNPGFVQEPSRDFAAAIKRLSARNIRVEVGRWDIRGRPRCLLVDFRDAVPRHDKLLYELWSDFGVDSMFGGWDYVEPVLFSTACGMVIEEIARDLNGKGSEVLAHFHEWMCGAGILYLKRHTPQVSTVLTTHATMLGRAMSGAGADIYAQLDQINPHLEAKNHNVTAKHSMEAVSAREADCFTTVSDITNLEVRAILGTPAAVVTPNGFDVQEIPDPAAHPEAAKEAHGRLVDFAAHFLGKPLKNDSTRIVAISGRYEFHNKGIDILIESLSRLNAELKAQGRTDLQIVTLFLVMGGHVGVVDEARVRAQQSQAGLEKYAGLSTHHLGDAQQDPIVKACERAQLMNAPEDPCGVILVPVYLDGHDGVLNMEYYEVLAGCDLGVFPSNYEPWGYTPHEAAAYAVPAITSDKAGFARWVRENFPAGQPGLVVLERFGKSDQEATDRLSELLRPVLDWDRAEMQRQRRGARQIAEKASWKDFYPFYREAYNRASTAKRERMAGIHKKRQRTELEASFAGTNSSVPRLRRFSVVTDLPEKIGRLREIALNLWWSWNIPAQELLAMVDPDQWVRLNHNPLALLETIDPKKLDVLVGNKHFLALYEEVLEQYDRYMNDSSSLVETVSEIPAAAPVAYFSMEFGIHECMPIYSGGLGILSGDHVKSASDLNLPFVGVSLLYKYGYFRQRINQAGEQIPEYVENNFGQLPVEVVKAPDGGKLLMGVDLPGRRVMARVWEAKVGRSRLLFLDTDIEENERADRLITSKLYDASTRERIEQELILGIGGARLMEALGIEPSVFHLNEGHSAFLLIERVRQLMQSQGLDFNTAKAVVKGSTVFTTHTPVAAGNERFERALMENYFRQYIQEMGIAWEDFWNLGHIFAGEQDIFEMTVLALKLSNVSNGVSRLHGETCRKLWQEVWSGFMTEEVPIKHITNGVHVASWMAEEVRDLVEKFSGIATERALIDPAPWGRIEEIPDAKIWQVHSLLKNRLIEGIKQRVQHSWTREGEAPDKIDRFRSRINPAALTIGFARRFATYKRPTLILRDLERLTAILSDETYPVQLIFAGKAHPADRAGADLIQQIVRLSKEDEFLGRIIFLEDYDIRVARALVSGVDVWLNNPIRPMEASGTSGMKAALNGVLNCSILDGWWDEGYNCLNGWAIGTGQVFEDPETQRLFDSDRLYELLENNIVPTFYRRNGDNVPQRWVSMMKSAMKSVIPEFNTHRMVQAYVNDMYGPTAARARRLAANNFELARTLSDWKKTIPARFSTVHIRRVKIHGISGDEVRLGSAVNISVQVDCGQVAPEEIVVEFVILDDGTVSPPRFVELNPARRNGTVSEYEGSFQPAQTGTYRYGVRVVPMHGGLESKYELALVTWS